MCNYEKQMQLGMEFTRGTGVSLGSVSKGCNERLHISSLSQEETNTNTNTNANTSTSVSLASLQGVY